MNLTPRTKRIARWLLHQGGMLRGIRWWNRQRYRILMYHGFPSATPGVQDSLRAQCAHIRRYYHPVSLNEIARHVREGVPLPANALAVTVDDGNRDFLLNAYPVFHDYQIPVTVFVVTGFLDQHLWLWWDQVSYLLENSRRSSFQLSLSPAHPPVQFFLGTAEQRQQSISTLTEAMKRLNSEERNRMIRDDLQGLLGLQLPDEPPPEMAPLCWAEVRQLAENGVDFGAHTLTHPVLSHLQDSPELQREICGSKQRLEEELRRPVLHFCYPYGLLEHVSAEAVKRVEQCRFHTAVVAEKGLNGRDADPFRLKRIGVGPLFPEFYFQELLAGLHLPDRPTRPHGSSLEPSNH